MKKINLLLIATLLGVSAVAFTQAEAEDNAQAVSYELTQEEPNIVRPLHISFISPISTNGLQSGEVTNILSLNILAGYSGGLQGIEVGGFANVIKGETKGVQVAGFSNTNTGDVTAVQLAGFSNVGFAKTKGAQFAGFANVARGSIEALQFAGFSNYSGTMTMGGQFAGFANVASGSVTGIQAAGFSNVARGMPLGGQLAGFANVNHGDAIGVQLSGFSNVNTGDIKGIQASGFLNVAKKVDGIQLGVINISDTIENGVGIGVFTFVKKGYKTLEVSGNETFYATASFKTGTNRLYNIISLGASSAKNEITWGWGYGIGTMLPVSKNMNLSIDVISYHVNEDVWFTNRLNSLNKLNVTLEYKISDFLTVYGGPTWNVHVSDLYDVEGVPTSTSLVSWNSFDRTRNNTNVKMYPGFTIGVRL